MARVVIEHLGKNFLGPKKEEIPALRDLSLTIEDKELLVLVGPTGSGKTTLLRTIAGLEEPTRGTISIDGQTANRIPAKDRDVAMVFQSYALYPHMTVFENIAFGLKLRKVAKAEIEKRVNEAAAVLGLTPFLERRPGALSGGERQRVALGRALVRKPKVFLLDEPLSNLDAATRARMRLELARLHARLAVTMIHVTHDQVEAMTLGQRIGVLHEGAIQQVAEPMRLYRHPANLFVAGFIGSPAMNFFDGELFAKAGGAFFAARSKENVSSENSLSLALPAALTPKVSPWSGRRLVLGIRPEDLDVRLMRGDQPAWGSPTASIAPSTIELIEPRGPETYLHLNAGGHGFTARVHPDLPARVGQTVSISFNFEKARFFDAASGNALG